MDERHERAQGFELGEGPAEDLVAAFVPARGAGALEVDDPRCAFTAVQRFDQRIGAVLKQRKRVGELLGGFAAALRDKADDGGGQQQDGKRMES